MHIFSNLKVVGLILALIAAGFFFMVSNKPKKVVEAPQPVVTNTAPSVSFAEEAEKRREQMLEEKADLERQEKLLREKENSVECQFWKQQKSASSDAKVDEKISEFCAFSSSSTGTSDASSPADTSTAQSSSAEAPQEQ